MFEVDTFLPSRAAQHQERHGGEDDADPLPEVQPFAEDQHRTNEHHDRPCRIDRTHDRDGQVFETEIAEHP